MSVILTPPASQDELLNLIRSYLNVIREPYELEIMANGDGEHYKIYKIRSSNMTGFTVKSHSFINYVEYSTRDAIDKIMNIFRNGNGHIGNIAIYHYDGNYLSRVYDGRCNKHHLYKETKNGIEKIYLSVYLTHMYEKIPEFNSNFPHCCRNVLLSRTPKMMYDPSKNHGISEHLFILGEDNLLVHSGTPLYQKYWLFGKETSRTNVKRYLIHILRNSKNFKVDNLLPMVIEYLL